VSGEDFLEIIAHLHRLWIPHRRVITANDFDARDAVAELQLLTDGFVEMSELPPRLGHVLDFDLEDDDGSVRTE